MYLSTPCPRPTCGQPTLRQPEQHGSVMLCLCDSCGRHARYIIREHVDGTQGYEVSIFGRDAEPSEIISKRIPSAHKAEISKEFDRVIAKHKRFVYKWKKGGTE